MRARFATLLLLAACASGPPSLPYPAYVDTNSLADVFLVELPGVRAKRFFADPKTRAASYRIELPAAWSGSSGGSADRAVEIFVLAGTVSLGTDFVLDAGGYAYLPPGSLGFNLASENGARILYAIVAVDAASLIRTPLITDADLLEWRETDIDGVDEKVLREDPGSGARTWLSRVEAGTTLPWQASLSDRESYLVAGRASWAECRDGRVVTGDYEAGGYVYRPADIVHAGPPTVVTADAVWLSREQSAVGERLLDDCG